MLSRGYPLSRTANEEQERPSSEGAGNLGTIWEHLRPNTGENGGVGPTRKQDESTRCRSRPCLQNLHPRFKSGRRLHFPPRGFAPAFARAFRLRSSATARQSAARSIPFAWLRIVSDLRGFRLPPSREALRRTAVALAEAGQAEGWQAESH